MTFIGPGSALSDFLDDYKQTQRLETEVEGGACGLRDVDVDVQLLQQLPGNIQFLLLNIKLEELFVIKCKEWKLIHQSKFKKTLRLFPQKVANVMPSDYFDIPRPIQLCIGHHLLKSARAEWMWTPVIGWKFKGCRVY